MFIFIKITKKRLNLPKNKVPKRIKGTNPEDYFTTCIHHSLL